MAEKSKMLIILEALQRELEDLNAVSLFGKQAAMLRLMGDFYYVNHYLEGIAKGMNEHPMVIDDEDVDYNYWAERDRWKFSTCIPVIDNEEIDKDRFNTVANHMLDVFGKYIDEVSSDVMRTLFSAVLNSSINVPNYTFEKIINLQIEKLTASLVKIKDCREKPWKDEEYTKFYGEMKADFENRHKNLNNPKNNYCQWKNHIPGCIDEEDYKRKRRIICLKLFESTFLDEAYNLLSHKADDDFGFEDMDDIECKDKTSTKGKYAVLKKMGVYKDDKLTLHPYAIGKYIYQQRIAKEVCDCYFEFEAMLSLVQQDLRYALHPDEKPLVEEEVVKAFVEKVKNLGLTIANKNGQVIETNNRGNKGTYKFEFDGNRFTQFLDLLMNEHYSKLAAYLKGKKKEEIGMGDVCSFFGYVLKQNRFQQEGFRNKDIEIELKDVFGIKTSAVRKLSVPMKSPEGDDLASAVEKLLHDWERTKLLLDKSKVTQ